LVEQTLCLLPEGRVSQRLALKAHTQGKRKARLGFSLWLEWDQKVKTGKVWEVIQHPLFCLLIVPLV
jgi:hypothetical protein